MAYINGNRKQSEFVINIVIHFAHNGTNVLIYVLSYLKEKNMYFFTCK